MPSGLNLFFSFLFFSFLFFSFLSTNATLPADDRLHSVRLFARMLCKPKHCLHTGHDACFHDIFGKAQSLVFAEYMTTCSYVQMTMPCLILNSLTAAATLVRVSTRRAGLCDSGCFSPDRHPRRSPDTCSSAKTSLTRLSLPCLPSAVVLLVKHSAAFLAIYICITHIQCHKQALLQQSARLSAVTTALLWHAMVRNPTYIMNSHVGRQVCWRGAMVHRMQVLYMLVLLAH